MYILRYVYIKKNQNNMPYTRYEIWIALLNGTRNNDNITKRIWIWINSWKKKKKKKRWRVYLVCTYRSEGKIVGPVVSARARAFVSITGDRRRVAINNNDDDNTLFLSFVKCVRHADNRWITKCAGDEEWAIKKKKKGFGHCIHGPFK